MWGLRPSPHPPCASLLTAPQDGRTPAWIAAEKGHEGALRVLVEAGADINKADTEVTSPHPLLLPRCL